MLDFDNPVIAAVRSNEEFFIASSSPVTAIFLLKSDIMTLGEVLKGKNGKKVFVHVDMIEGVGRDKKGLELLKSLGVDGIISTKSNLIIMAKEQNLETVQRFFIVDSLSVNTALDIVKSTKPDYAELMPGVITKAIKGFVEKTRIPIIAGGLIQEKSEIISALKVGASAVSTAEQTLWNL